MKLLFALLIPLVAVADEFPPNYCAEDVTSLCNKYKYKSTQFNECQVSYDACLSSENQISDALITKTESYNKLLKKAKKLKKKCGSACDGISLSSF